KKTPVILTVYDGYMFGAGAYDLAIDVEEVFGKIVEMSYCHQSQIVEWIPWVGRHGMPSPKSSEEWGKILRARFDRKNRQLGIASARAFETFTVTAWGEVPTMEQLLKDFPSIDRKASNLEALGNRLRR